MSYKNKLSNYQGDCIVELGKYQKFSDYIEAFARSLNKDRKDDEKLVGLDIGAGPGGCNGLFLKDLGVLHGCDADPDVVKTIPSKFYQRAFTYVLGSKIPLPYKDDNFDYVISSCMIQHLNSFAELETGIKEISRVIRLGGFFYLMFKAGANDTNLTHHNNYYGEERTFRVFHPDNVISLCKKYGFGVVSTEKLIDGNWLPYCCLIFVRVLNVKV